MTVTLEDEGYTDEKEAIKLLGANLGGGNGMALSIRNESKKTAKHARRIARDSRSMEKETRDELSKLPMTDLKYLMKLYGVKCKTKIGPGLFAHEKKPHTRKECIDALVAKGITPDKIKIALRRRSEKR